MQRRAAGYSRYEVANEWRCRASYWSEEGIRGVSIYSFESEFHGSRFYRMF